MSQSPRVKPDEKKSFDNSSDQIAYYDDEEEGTEEASQELNEISLFEPVVWIYQKEEII
jgi:hypothetical protein